MKVKKIFALVTACLILLSGCNSAKKAQKNLLKEIKEITTNSDTFSSCEKDVDNLLKGYLMVNPNDKEVKSVSVILNSSEDDIQKNIENFIKENKKSIFREFVEYLEIIGINDAESKFELIPDFEKKYSDSVFLEKIYFTELIEILWSDIYLFSKDSWFLTPASEESLTVKNKKMVENINKASSFLTKYPNSNSKSLNFCREAKDYMNMARELYSLKQEGNYEKNIKALATIDEFFEKYPDTKLRPGYIKNERELLQAETDLLKEKMESKIWYIKNYVDSKGNPTNDEYLSNEYVSGTLKNKKGTESPSKIRFLIDSRTKMAMMIYEQDEKVKGRKDEYSMEITNSIGAVYKLSGVNYEDRISLDDENSLIMNNLLKGDDIILIKIKCNSTSAEYSYEFDTAGYAKVFGRLK